MPARPKPFGLRGASLRWWVVLAVLVVASVALYLSRRPAADLRARFGGPTMGTSYEVILGEPLPPEALRSLQAKVDALLAEINRSMSTYDPTSELSRFNQLRSTEPVTVSESLAEVIALAQQVSRASGGAFDVTVGPLVDAWGFGPGGRPKRAPTDEELAALKERVGYEKLTLEGRQLSKAHPALEVDLSAIAKGWAVDQVAELLEQSGHLDYMVEIGGEVRARGHNPEGRPFRIGIERPDPEGQSVLLAVTLSDEALATSGNYRNFFELDGQRYVHTVDPITGRPIPHRLLSASVIDEQCAVADAWATALMAAGSERAWALAQEQDLAVLLIEAGEGDALVQRATESFKTHVLPAPGAAGKE